jgi:DNA repair exonuclease SbcCD nuclease subunit
MKYPYLLLSDTHYHAWDAFSTVTPTGVNSRLDILLRETRRAYEHLKSVGGTHVFHAGDMFHTRGSLVPSVINPVREEYSRAAGQGLSTYAIAGNHDLESNDTRWLTAATSAMPVQFTEDVTRIGDVVLVNWHSSVKALMVTLEALAAETRDRKLVDLIIHAPVDGVLVGIPSHSLTAAMLAELGFRRVFSGHYHNHKDFENGVYSIGALTHQTWSDVGTKAGYCLVYPDRVEWHESNAPKFIDVQTELLDTLTADELSPVVVGNYCRTTLIDPTAKSEARTRTVLNEAGAVGVLIRSQKSASKMSTRREETKGIASLEATVSKYAELKGGEPLAALCAEIMTAVT